jgi:hypothetical protein
LAAVVITWVIYRKAEKPKQLAWQGMSRNKIISASDDQRKDLVGRFECDWATSTWPAEPGDATTYSAAPFKRCHAASRRESLGSHAIVAMGVSTWAWSHSWSELESSEAAAAL